MKARTLRHLIIGLLSLTGVFHLLVAMFGGAGAIALPLAGFGFVYLIIGFFVRQDTNDGSKSHSRNAILAAIAACSVGLILGGANYLKDGGPFALPLMFLIDIVIIGAGVMWVMKVQGKKRH